MGARNDTNERRAAATRWRRPAACVLVADAPVAAAIRTVSGAGARLDTRARPRLGDAIELRHPDAGAILGTVDAHLADGIALRFDRDAHAVAFAMTAIAADMSRPA